MKKSNQWKYNNLKFKITNIIFNFTFVIIEDNIEKRVKRKVHRKKYFIANLLIGYVV